MKKLRTVEVKLTVRLPLEMHTALVEAARAHHRSLNGEILTALGDHLKKSQKERTLS
jgi:predicted HicB family RNase H-like nuclease